ncbi:hypothetical protein HUT16_06965 [Kitasatospora sp. NA04385]|uniref:hypothetical protein n=1 Tax=Kitasatospora sp. NA04385 TaxID=2742135 RepID=UPI001592AD64|nr:hypothetical protein [Kitasatospora sp. NA04385]QKW18844.1 hypothetical protein HUT16_06965 [Kitasatospora sp. NA04385]
MPMWLLDVGLTPLIVLGESLAVAGWFFRGSFEVARGRRGTTPRHRVAAELAGTALFLGGTAVGLLRLGLPVAANVQSLLAVVVALLLVTGLAGLARDGVVGLFRRRGPDGRPGPDRRRGPDRQRGSGGRRGGN